MTTITLPTQSNSSRLTQWLLQGWTLFTKAPLKLFFTLLAAMVIAGLLQFLPAPTGILVSKWVGACFAAMLWPLLDHLAKSNTLSFKGLATYSGWKHVPLISLALMTPFFLQLGVAAAMLGSDGVNLVMSGDIAATVTPLHVATIFAASAPLVVILMFVPANLLLANQSPKEALYNGIEMVFKAWQPMIGLTLFNAIILFLAPFTFALSALLLSPILVCINYAAYQSLRRA